MLFAANRGYGLTSSRETLLRHFIELGWRVIIATADDPESRYLVSLGALLEPVDFNRGGLALVADIHAYRQMKRVYRKWQPVLAHHFNAKPVIAGTLAARRALGDCVYVCNTITGLGHAFVAGGLTSRVAGLGYRSAALRADATIFQNRDDRALFLTRGWVAAERTRLIVGSGIDVARFASGAPVRSSRTLAVIMLGRLIWPKGVAEFELVARHMRARHPDVEFLWAGEMDPQHPDAVPQTWLDEQTAFEYLGRVPDVPERLRAADVMLFPSYYREGVPRAVMEAAASGVPVVGCDVPGVREAVRHEETGFLVPDRDVDALTAAVARLLADRALRERMGAAARRLAEAEFDIRSIQSQHLALYRELGVDIPAE